MDKDQEDQAAASLSIVAASKEIGMEEKKLSTFNGHLSEDISFKMRGYKLAWMLKKCTTNTLAKNFCKLHNLCHLVLPGHLQRPPLWLYYCICVSEQSAKDDG